MSYNIFLSHSAADSSQAKLIKDKIQKMHISVYHYGYDPQPGIYIARKLQKALKKADAVLVLLTRQGQHSPYVNQEIGYAEAKGKRIIALVEPGTSENVLGMLAAKDRIPFEYNNIDSTIAQLKSHLQELKANNDRDQRRKRKAVVLAAVAGCAIAFKYVR